MQDRHQNQSESQNNDSEGQQQQNSAFPNMDEALNQQRKKLKKNKKNHEMRKWPVQKLLDEETDSFNVFASTGQESQTTIELHININTTTKSDKESENTMMKRKLFKLNSLDIEDNRNL